MESLYASLIGYNKKGVSSFHTPGHKGVGLFDENIWSLDLTEIPEADSLYEAKGVLLESEKRAAGLFGSVRSLISAGGNTLCIQTMLRLATLDGRPVLSGRNVHRSAVSAMALLGIQPCWIDVARDAGYGMPGRVKSEDVLDKMDSMGEACAVYITSPDYYGVLSDIRSIARECRARESYLIVDNAHGTHLKFLKNSLHPLDLGATMSADSAHKTLPVMTGGAWFHISDRKLSERAKESMAIFGSTSPSYPVMCSLDTCLEYLKIRGRQDFEILSKKVNFIKGVAADKGIFLPSGMCDPTRITLMVSSIGYSGYEFADYMRKSKIEPEFSDEDYVVFIPSPFNSKEDWARLEDALSKIPVKERGKICEDNDCIKLPKINMTLREAMFSAHTLVNVENSLGRVAGEIVCPCPPGVPVVMPGEVIGEQEKEALQNYGVSQLRVVK